MLAVAATATPAGASAVTVAQPGAATSVREYGGTIVFSQFDWATHRWHLNVRRKGAQAPERLDVAPSAVAFNADIGTDGNGRPEVIYQRCARAVSTTTPPMYAPTGCELYVYSLAGPTGERPVRNANDPAHNDVNPTLWRGRIAWTREYGSGESQNPVVYTKTLAAPRSRPSTRLPGVPQTRCGDVDRVCGPTTSRGVSALELGQPDGTGSCGPQPSRPTSAACERQLAVVVRYACTGCSGISQTELRLDALRAGSSRPLARLTSGLNGQYLTGPSFFEGRLAWYSACAVPEASCRTSVGPWRYRLSKGSYERGAPGPVTVTGFADTGTHLYEVLGCSDDTLSPPDFALQTNARCRIDRSSPPSYSSARPPLG